MLGCSQHAEALPVAGLGDLVGAGQRLDEARRVQHDGVREVGVHVVGVGERLGEGAAGGGHVPVERLQVGAGDEHGDQQGAVGGEAPAEQGAQLQRGGHRGGRPLGQLADRAEESVLLVAVGEGPGAGQGEPEGGLGGGGALGGEFEVGVQLVEPGPAAVVARVVLQQRGEAVGVGGDGGGRGESEPERDDPALDGEGRRGARVAGQRLLGGVERGPAPGLVLEPDPGVADVQREREVPGVPDRQQGAAAFEELDGGGEVLAGQRARPLGDQGPGRRSGEPGQLTVARP